MKRCRCLRCGVYDYSARPDFIGRRADEQPLICTSCYNCLKWRFGEGVIIEYVVKLGRKWEAEFDADLGKFAAEAATNE